jgi:hypothetical protein
MADRFFRGSVGLALAVVALITVGCGGRGASLADDVGRFIDDAIKAGTKQADDQIRLSSIGQTVPEGQLSEISTQADGIGERLARFAEDKARTYGDDVKGLVDTACTAKGLSEGELFEKPLSQEARELALELQKTENGGDAAAKIAVFGFCNLPDRSD